MVGKRAFQTERVVAAEILTPTMSLRWYEVMRQGAIQRILQQCWMSNTGEQHWKDIEIVVGDKT